MIRFERPRVAMDFKALADSLPERDGIDCVEVEPHHFARQDDMMGRLKAHINDRVMIGRARRKMPLGEFFDLYRDDCCASPALRQTNAVRDLAILNASQDESAA